MDARVLGSGAVRMRGRFLTEHNSDTVGNVVTTVSQQLSTQWVGNCFPTCKIVHTLRAHLQNHKECRAEVIV